MRRRVVGVRKPHIQCMKWGVCWLVWECWGSCNGNPSTYRIGLGFRPNLAYKAWEEACRT